MSAAITQNIMLELRQASTDAANAGGELLGNNGEYNVTLPERVTIEENDVISIESVFIDDEGENDGKIVLENDVNGHVACNMYLVDTNPSQYYNSPPVPMTTFRTFSDAIGNHPDGQKYFLASLDDASANGNQRRVSSLQFQTHTKITDFGTAEDAQVKLVFAYVNAHGDNAIITLVLRNKHLTKFSAVPSSEKYLYTIDQGILDAARADKSPSGNAAGVGTFNFPFLIRDINLEPVLNSDPVAGTEPIYPKDLKGVERSFGIKYGESAPIEVSHHISVREHTAYFNLPAGKYDPDDLARRITDQITSPFNRLAADGVTAITKGDIGRTGPIPADGSGQPAFNNFTETELFTVSQRLFSQGLEFSGNVPNTSPVWLRDDGEKYCTMAADFANINQWCGASNFGLSYNGVDRFEFTNLHNSIYSDGTGGAAGVKIVRGVNVGNVAGGANGQFIANAHSGLSISRLHPTSLWVDKMGFSVDQAVHTPVYKSAPGLQYTKADGTVVTPSVETMDHLVEGNNYTGDMASTDVLMFKSGADTTSNPNRYAYDLAGASIDGITTAVQQTYPVVGDLITHGAKQANAYYLIEVDGGFPSRIIGHDHNNNKIQGIVGRYYSGTTYTQSTGGEGAIAYQHKGNPLQLSNLKVRITLPDGSLATLGPDNTVFVKITKAK